ncbi:hypothetical protein [Microcoleus sp. AT3-D2]
MNSIEIRNASDRVIGENSWVEISLTSELYLFASETLDRTGKETLALH